jgi:hypothetical protein
VVGVLRLRRGIRKLYGGGSEGCQGRVNQGQPGLRIYALRVEENRRIRLSPFPPFASPMSLH